MSLLTLWETNKEDIESKQIQQLVGLAGDGNLKDDSACSKEIREYISQVNIDLLEQYLEQCLAKSFNNSGLVLQDLVNELGRRLDFDVKNGLYQGRSNQVGFDGLWYAPEGFSIVAEVKTTDAYRITLDTLAKYRNQLRTKGEINDESSILIIVGRQETGEIEAQVRGSRHAWDMRIISVDALLSLLKVKVLSEEDTSEKVRLLLRPMEYTKLDKLVEIIYTTAQDVDEAAETQSEGDIAADEKEEKKLTFDFTDTKVLDAKREEIIKGFEKQKNKALIKKTRATYWSADRDLRVGCTISKPYDKGYKYWYAFHRRWDEFMMGGEESFMILGCMDLDHAYAIPRDVIIKNLDNLNITPLKDGKKYWHLQLAENENGTHYLNLPKIKSSLDIEPYKFTI